MFHFVNTDSDKARVIGSIHGAVRPYLIDDIHVCRTAKLIQCCANCISIAVYDNPAIAADTISNHYMHFDSVIGIIMIPEGDNGLSTVPNMMCLWRLIVLL